MKIQPLHDLQREIDRLFIAGSKFVKDDPRLLKVAGSLDQLGDKAPVFKRLAAEVRSLASADAGDSAGILGALGGMLYSVLYTQGDQLAEPVERLPQEPFIPLDLVRTDRSHAELAAVRDLAYAKSGRFELAREALEQGVFRDFRTFPLLDSLLGDRYSELAEFVVGTAVPAAGEGAAFFVMRNFQYQDTAENVRRFRALAHFDLPGLTAMTERIFAESLPNLQAAAIPFLARSVDNEEMILKLTGDRNRKVREAAIAGLAALSTPRSLDLLLSLFLDSKSGEKRLYAGGVLGEVRAEGDDNPVIDRLIRQAEAALTALLAIPLPKKRGGILGKVVDKLQQAVGLGAGGPEQDVDPGKYIEAVTEADQALSAVLQTLCNKNAPCVIAFLGRMLTDPGYAALEDFHVRSGAEEYRHHQLTSLFEVEYVHVIDEILTGMGGDVAVEFYEKHMAMPPKGVWSAFLRSYLYAAVPAWPAERVYDVFVGAFLDKKLPLATLYTAFQRRNPDGGISYEEEPLEADRIDARWTKYLYERSAGAFDVVQHGHLLLKLLDACEPEGSPRFNKYLSTLRTTGVSPRLEREIVRILMARRHPQRFELVYQALAREGEKPFLTASDGWEAMWRAFPKEYAAKFRELANECLFSVFAEIAEVIEQGTE